MDSQQAKEILMRYRPGTDDAADPEVVQALEQAKRDPALGHWLDQHRLFQSAVRDRLRQLPVPAGLKEEILAAGASADVLAWWRHPLAQALAAAAAIVLLIGLAAFWKHAPEDKSFHAFRQRMVRNAQRGYVMDMTATNLDEIRQFLAAHQAHADYVLPAPLEKLPGDGCAILHWHNKMVSMVCFALGSRADLFLFVASRSDLPDAPSARDPEFTRIGKLTAASWSAGDKTYILAGPGDQQFIDRYLR
jgi:uncharacterized membrane protein YbaN (DUF454 family)